MVVGFTVFQADQLEFADRGDGSNRSVAGLSDAMTQMRANVWRYGPGARGRRHADRIQEETFVVLEGTPSMLLGDPPERFQLAPGSVVVVQPGTGLQIRNESDEEAILFIVGAPPERGGSDTLPDVD
jgi:mannose-6-phosphate isomerase-like protein (cupin superfamily)